MSIATAKAAHIAEADKRWADAVKGIRPHLTYDSNVFYGEADEFKTPEAIANDALVRKLTRLLFTVCESTQHSLFGGAYGHGIDLNSYSGVYSLCGMMEFVKYFVGHEMLDDGEPGLGYTRSTMGDKPRSSAADRARCGPDDEGAEPYFCRSIDWLQEDYPDAEWLTLESAIEALEFHENKRAKIGESMRKQRANWPSSSLRSWSPSCIWSEATVAYYTEPSRQQIEWTAVIDEIIAMEDE